MDFAAQQVQLNSPLACAGTPTFTKTATTSDSMQAREQNIWFGINKMNHYFANLNQGNLEQMIGDLSLVGGENLSTL